MAATVSANYLRSFLPERSTFRRAALDVWRISDDLSPRSTSHPEQSKERAQSKDLSSSDRPLLRMAPLKRNLWHAAARRHPVPCGEVLRLRSCLTAAQDDPLRVVAVNRLSA